MTDLLSELGNRPQLSIPGACRGRAEMQAAYRFFDNQKVSFNKLLTPHAQQTLGRMAEHPVVLLVNDSSEIELTRPEQQVRGAGLLDRSRRGVLLHAMHAFTPEGTPLGTASAQCLNRPQTICDESVEQKARRRKHTPIEEKESMRWLADLRRARDIAAGLPRVRCVYVADSEAEIHELFAEFARENGRNAPGQLHLLIRACHDRALRVDDRGQPRHLRERLRAAPLRYEIELRIRGRRSKLEIEDRRRRQTRQGRVAKMEVRAAPVTLRGPWRVGGKLPSVKMNAVLVREADPPAGEPPVEWILLTTLPIDTIEQVRQVVEYYCVRWNIEILFRTLKSGCRIERRRFEHVDRIVRCLGLYLIVAWRTLLVCRMGRECPDADCEVLFEPSEWKAAWTAVHRKKLPATRPRLSEMVKLVAGLGGYVPRRNSEPGPQTVWIGLQRMHDLAWAWDTFGPETRADDG